MVQPSASQSSTATPADAQPSTAAQVAEPTTPIGRRQRGPVGHQVAFAVVATVLLFTVLMLPFVVGDVYSDLFGPRNESFQLTAPTVPASARSYLHLELTALGDWAQTITMQVSGHHVCDTPCNWSVRFLLVAARKDAKQQGLPAFGAVTLPAEDKVVTQSVTLPLEGDPVRYPFDTYDFRLGVVVQWVFPDGSVTTLTPEDAKSRLFLSMRLGIPNVAMHRPGHLQPEQFRVNDSEYSYVALDEVVLERPLRLKVLAVLLVLLVAAGAAYAVFLRPLDQLVLSAGALVLGVWGIRSILLSSTAPTGAAALDITLSMVILFLLAALSARALHYYDQRSGFRILQRRPWRRSRDVDQDAPPRDEMPPPDHPLASSNRGS
jgi:hypothetical protein